MKRLVFLTVLLVLAAVPSVASAAPNKGDPITFRFTEGQFCAFGCTDARARIEGTIKITPRPGGRAYRAIAVVGELRIELSAVVGETSHRD